MNLVEWLIAGFVLFLIFSFAVSMFLLPTFKMLERTHSKIFLRIGYLRYQVTAGAARFLSSRALIKNSKTPTEWLDRIYADISDKAILFPQILAAHGNASLPVLKDLAECSNTGSDVLVSGVYVPAVRSALLSNKKVPEELRVLWALQWDLI